MRHAFSLLAILSLAAGATGVATASPALDSAGKCRDNGKFVDSKLCATNAAEHCRDVKTKKFAKCGMPGTEPVPASK
jgi:hypothetical protein